jgi:hypothetical protein
MRRNFRKVFLHDLLGNFYSCGGFCFLGKKFHFSKTIPVLMVETEESDPDLTGQGGRLALSIMLFFKDIL